MGAPCKICGLGYAEQRKIDRSLLAGDTLTAVMARFGLPSRSSLQRHRAAHLDRAVRAPERIDEDRSAADVLVALADALVDLERIRNDAIRHGRTASALKATTEARAISKILFADLALDNTSTATWLRDLDAVWQAMRRLIRADPALALALADAVHPEDSRMARELRGVYSLITERTEEHAA